MSRERESHVSVGRNARFGRKEKLHAHQLMTYLVLGGIFMVFAVLLLAFAGAQLYTINGVGARLPIPFWYSTGVILLSSYTVYMAKRAQKLEQYKRMTVWLCGTAGLGILFMALQLIGWNELQMQGIYLNGAAAGSYIYVISGLHLMHILGGLAFIVYTLSYSVKASVDAVSALIYSTDKYRNYQMQILSSYWHFMGALWVFMFAIFFLLLGR